MEKYKFTGGIKMKKYERKKIKTEESEFWTWVLILVILIIFSVPTIELGKSMERKNRKTILKNINNQWIQELNKRGLIIMNPDGGFKWKDEKYQ